jgi:hypothetical protein
MDAGSRDWGLLVGVLVAGVVVFDWLVEAGGEDMFTRVMLLRGLVLIAGGIDVLAMRGGYCGGLCGDLMVIGY